jgi:hypothetical protein
MTSPKNILPRDFRRTAAPLRFRDVRMFDYTATQ